MEGLTFDDVLLIPAYSKVLPREVSLSTKFSRNIELKVPFVTAAMDTVTEAPMAIAIAREGGIGVIHKNMSIAEQAAHVRRVKRAENGMIYDPITIGKDQTVGDALQLMHDNKIGGIPVIRPLNNALTAEKIEAILGIVNGTTNYMLTKMEKEGADYDAVLKQAQELGYAERDLFQSDRQRARCC